MQKSYTVDFLNKIRADNEGTLDQYYVKNALERVRGKQMIELTTEWSLEFEIPELTRMVLEEIIVRDKKTFTVKLLDGTEQNISL